MNSREMWQFWQRWRDIYRRVRYFPRIVPLATLAREIILFPWDYWRDGGRITTVRSLQVAVTTRCNQRCTMCYVHKELDASRVMSLAMFRDIILSVRSSRPAIILTGGEPFTHPDLAAMVALVKENGMVAQVYSNGVLATPERVAPLLAAGLDYLNITLLGNPETHNLIAGIPRAYDLMNKNLLALSKSVGDHTKITLNYTLTPQSCHQAAHAFELASRYGLHGVRLQHLMYLRPEESSCQHQEMLRLFGTTPELQETEINQDVSAMMAEVLSLKRRVESEWQHISVQWAPTLSDEEIRMWYGPGPFVSQRRCFFPWRGMLIHADGTLYPCSKIYLPLGQVAEVPLLDAWNVPVMGKFRRHLKKGLFPACSRCCKL